MPPLKPQGDVEQLRTFYYETLGGGKIDKVWHRVKKQFPGQYTRAQVKDFIDNQASAQQTKQFKRNPKMFTSIRGKKPGNIYQIDLMFFKNVVGPQRYSGVLNVVDVYSRFAWSELIKQDPKPKNHKVGTPWKMSQSGGKGQQSVLQAFKKIISRGKVPKHVTMDEGNEFTNSSFMGYLSELRIKPHFSRPETFVKNPIVERFNRTLRDAFRDRLAQGKTMAEAVKGLQQMMERYNSDIHSTIKAEPAEVWEGEDKNHQTYKNPTFNFKEGDKVRILKRQSDFKKSGAYQWSEEVHTVYDIQKRTAGSSKVSRYFVMDEDDEILTYVDKADKREHPTWFLGYQLLLANKGERAPAYNATKAKKAKAQEATKDQKAKQRRRLAKEGLDDASKPTARKQPKRQVRTDPLSLVGKRIRVKWFDAGPLTAKAERARGTQGKFFPGKVVSFVSTKKRYKIAYEDDVDSTYLTNLTEASQSSYIKPSNWRSP